MNHSRDSAPSVTVHLMGGLGNQLFQYAFGRRLAYVNGADLYLDASGYAGDVRPDPRQGIRICELGHFRIAGRLIGRAESTARGRRALRRKAEKAWLLLQSLGDARHPYYLRREIVEPEGNRFRFDRHIFERPIAGRVTVRGFWQTERYFADIQHLLRTELDVADELEGANASMARCIRESNSVAIHVRHGDNAGPVAPALGLLPAAYYRDVISALHAELKDPRFFIFSDDVQWAKELLGNDPQMTYAEQNGSADGHEDLRLMTLCKHHVLANSTFGWWGAWLGRKAGQIVFAPKRYYQNIDKPNPDLYPADWRLV